MESREYEVRALRNKERVDEKEVALEKKVIKGLELMDNCLRDFKDEDFVLPTTLLNDYLNPTREEINRELNRITGLMSYLSQLKADCQMLVANKEMELDYFKAKAREWYKKEFDTERNKWMESIFGEIDKACKTTQAAKIAPTIKAAIEKSKLSAPTEKDYEAYVNTRQQVVDLKRDLIAYESRLSRFVDMSYILNKRHQDILELSKQLHSADIANVQYAKNN